jgi:predicted metal-dependent phosphoesterase TrpH
MTDDHLIDLHVHSAFSSDGQHSPAALIDLAAAAGLAAIALTDHDEVGGLAEFVRAGEARGVEAIPGVELTCDLGERWVHILGYFVDAEAPALKDAIAALTQARLDQLEGRLVRLYGLGITVDRARLKDLSRGQPPVGPIIGMVVLNDPANDGHPLLEPLRVAPKAAMPYFHFDRDMLSHGMPAYYPVRRPSPRDALATIAAAGGVAVFAHPGDRFRLPEDRAVFADLARAGLAGLEAWCSYHTREQEPAFAALAAELGIVATAGSDFHGDKVKPHVKLGGISHHPYEILAALKARKKGRG